MRSKVKAKALRYALKKPKKNSKGDIEGKANVTSTTGNMAAAATSK